MRSLFLSFVLSFAAAVVSSAGAAPQLGESQVQVRIVPGFDPFDTIVPVSQTGGGLVTVASDSSWVVPRYEAAEKRLVLEYNTGGLVKATNTATVTVSEGGETTQLIVSGALESLRVVKLLNDPFRNLVYGLHYRDLKQGLLLVIDPDDGSGVGSLLVGEKPTDLALSPDGSELLVINAVGKSLSVVDLNEMVVEETIALPVFTNWGENDTTADLAYGAGDLVYYTDGAWAPQLHVFDRSSKTVVQTLGTGSGQSYGFGDFVISPDGNSLYAWGQYGWTAGNSNSVAMQFSMGEDAKFAFVKEVAHSLNRNPLDVPALIASDGTSVFLREVAVDPSDVGIALRRFSGPVYSASINGELVGTADRILEGSSGNLLLDLPVSAPVQTISDDYSRFVYFDSNSSQVKVIDLFASIDMSAFAGGASPQEGAIVLPDVDLGWSAVPGASSYQIYWGQNQALVESATPSSDEYRAEVSDIVFDPDDDFESDATYYWRVDVVSSFGTRKGIVRSFRSRSISLDQSSLKAVTIVGHRDYKVDLVLNSSVSAEWSISSNVDWISFDSESGASPGVVEVNLDAGSLALGEHTAALSFTSEGESPIVLPVKLQVEPLHLRQIVTSNESAFAYAISEDEGTTGSKAYLLEINTITEQISRVVSVGTSATDIALNASEKRIYVTNWRSGALLAIDMDSLEVVDTFGFEEGGGYYSDRDIYRISTGPDGRVIAEAQDQWIDIFLIDTENGSVISHTSAREGGGEYSPDGRYYYHGDSNISNASLHRYDLLGDVFTLLDSTRVESTGYYGSRTVVVSGDGSRIFWNGAVFDESLNVLWEIGEIIHSVSANGKLAFGENNVYDVERKRRVADMPVSSTVSGYAEIASKLILQKEGRLYFESFYSDDESRSPIDGALSLPVDTLTWRGVPVALEYRVYFGEDEAGVVGASGESELLLGVVTSNEYQFESVLTPGTYYWKVETITPYGNVVSETFSFQVGNVAPSVSELHVDAVEGYDSIVLPFTLQASSGSVSWSITSSKDWITVNAQSGMGGAEIEVLLDASNLGFGLQEESITISVDGDDKTLVLPLFVNVQKLELTVLESDPSSQYIYGISETVEDNGSPQAFLLKIDTELEKIVGTAYVGSDVTDIAIHKDDGVVYVANWKIGELWAVKMDTLEVVEIFQFDPSSERYGSSTDVYEVTAAGAGRILVEGEDQWVDLALFDTEAGVIVKKVGVREGGGGTGGTLRYYYHGDNNSSGAELSKYDLFADELTLLGSKRTSSYGYYGSRVVTVSEDGQRIFWNGAMFNDSLEILYEFGQEVFSANKDGSLAFTQNRVYDTDRKVAILGMPATTKVSAFNSSTNKLVTQYGSRVGFFDLSDPGALAAPSLAVDTVTHSSIGLVWTDDTLETGFSLQYREKGNSSWNDYQGDIEPNVTDIQVSGLLELTSYEFRIRAFGPEASSDWSLTMEGTTLATPPPVPYLYSGYASGAYEIILEYGVNEPFDRVLVERASKLDPNNWTQVASFENGANLRFVDQGTLQPQTAYLYRARTLKDGLYSAFSDAYEIWTYELQVPQTPFFQSAIAQSESEVLLNWSPSGGDVETFQLEYRQSGQGEWQELSLLGRSETTYVHRGLVKDTSYEYRVSASNAKGRSDYSNIVEATPRKWLILASDDFEDGLDPVVWFLRTPGIRVIEDSNNLNEGSALWIDAGVRQSKLIQTMVLDLSTAEFVDMSLRVTDQWDESGASAPSNALYNRLYVRLSTPSGSEELFYSYGNSYEGLGNWTSLSFEIPQELRVSEARIRIGIVSSSSPVRLGIDNFRVRSVTLPNDPPQVGYTIATAVNPNVAKIEWPMPIPEVVGARDLMGFQIERKIEGGVWVTAGNVHAGESPSFVDTSLPAGKRINYRVISKLPWGESLPSTPASITLDSSLSHWRSINFGPERAGDQSLDTEVDSYGVQNLVRYAFGLEIDALPFVHEPGGEALGLPVVFWDANDGIRIEYPRRKADLFPDIEYVLQVSSNGEDWTDVAGAEVESKSINGTWEVVRFVLKSSESDESPRLARIALRWMQSSTFFQQDLGSKTAASTSL